MSLPNGAGGYQLGDGNLGEVNFFVQGAPASIPAGAATLTTDQVATGIVLGNPGTSAAAYTLPTAALMNAAFPSMGVDRAFDFSVINVDGSSSGVITLTASTGFTIVGLATVAANAGAAHQFRARKTGASTWVLYRLS
jgi:hypothetical protein